MTVHPPLVVMVVVMMVIVILVRVGFMMVLIFRSGRGSMRLVAGTLMMVRVARLPRRFMGIAFGRILRFGGRLRMGLRRGFGLRLGSRMRSWLAARMLRSLVRRLGSVRRPVMCTAAVPASMSMAGQTRRLIQPGADQNHHKAHRSGTFHDVTSPRIACSGPSCLRVRKNKPGAGRLGAASFVKLLQ